MYTFLEGLTLAEIEEDVEAGLIETEYGEWLVWELIKDLDF
jgi:hypothetical protein